MWLWIVQQHMLATNRTCLFSRNLVSAILLTQEQHKVLLLKRNSIFLMTCFVQTYNSCIEYQHLKFFMQWAQNSARFYSRAWNQHVGIGSDRSISVGFWIHEFYNCWNAQKHRSNFMPNKLKSTEHQKWNQIKLRQKECSTQTPRSNFSLFIVLYFYCIF